MNQAEMAWGRLIERFAKWARTRPDIRGAAIVGSRARTDRPADEWADLDLIVITTDPERYLSETDWLEEIGDPWLTFVEPTATGGERERRVLFEGGLDVDFTIIPYGRVKQLEKEGIPPETWREIAHTFGRGMRVLLDRDGILAELSARISAASLTHRPPTQDEFLGVINDFLYHAVWTAKKLGRGELWTAKFCLDSYMKWRCLLRMMEWHARASRGWDYDTWHGGRFLEEWADPRVLEGLREAFAHYDEEDIGRALLASMGFFRWIAVETAEKLGYQYPTEAHERITELVNVYLSENATS